MTPHRPQSRPARFAPALLGLAAALASVSSSAAPVGFADSWMLMGGASRDFKELDLMYSPTHRYSYAATFTRLEDDERDRRVDLSVAHWNRLLWRVNRPESQFNGYLTLGAGNARSNAAFAASRGAERNESVASLAGQIDWETRRLYVAGKAHWWASDAFTVGNHSAQAGFSFYKTEWDETQPWLIAEVSRMPGITDGYGRAIYLRLIDKGFFVEAGIDQDRHPKLNFRYTF